MSGAGTTTIAAGGHLTLGNGQSILDTRTLNNAGTATWIGGAGFQMVFFNSAQFNNQLGGVLDLQTDQSFALQSGTPAFNNAGTLKKSGGAGATGFSVALNNSGTVQALSGTLNFVGTFTQTAGNTFLNGGSIQTSTQLNIQGGTLTGSGTITGNVANSGGAIAPGTAAATGAIALHSTYTQGANAAYNAKIGGAAAGQFDQLSANGAATLNGTLNVSLLNGFSPSQGQSFVILTATSITGTFPTTNLPPLGTGLAWKVNYTATTVTLTVGLAPDLTITKSHTGNFFQTQKNASYSIQVKNIGGAPTDGSTVTV